MKPDDSPVSLPNQPLTENKVLSMAYSPSISDPNNTYRLERGVIRLRNGKTVSARAQFKGAPLYGKINSNAITKNPGYLDPTTGAIISAGSIPKTVSSPGFTFTAPDPTDLVISWSTYANRLVDGNSIILQAGSITISGLVAATLYWFHPFWSIPAMGIGWVQGGSGLPAIAWTTLLDANIQTQNLQQNFSFGAIYFTQPASGSGSGGSGGSGGGGNHGGGGRGGGLTN